MNNCKVLPLTIFLLMCLTLISFSGLAGDNINFTISGRFLPATCNIALSKNNINVGNIKYRELETQNTDNRFMERTTDQDVRIYKNIEKATLVVECDNLASVGLTVIDNNSSYAPLNFIHTTNSEGTDISNVFGLKPTSGINVNSKLGGYFFEFTNPLVMGEPGKDINKDFNTGFKDSKISNAGWIKKRVPGDLTLSKFWTYTNTDEPIQAKTFKVDLKPNLFFYYDRTNRDLNDEIAFEGSVTFTIFYI
ncbi:MAG: hypothetical protein ACEY29_00235 [Arsenophonus sp.]